MATPLNFTSVMEVLVAITSRLYRTGTYPYADKAFDEWQERILRLVEAMSVRLDKEEGFQPVTVLEADDPSYEEMMDQLQTLLDEGIQQYQPSILWMNINR